MCEYRCYEQIYGTKYIAQVTMQPISLQVLGLAGWLLGMRLTYVHACLYVCVQSIKQICHVCG